MVGDTCIDNLILGSPNASYQDQKPALNADSGGAGGLRDHDEQEERGSCHLESD